MKRTILSILLLALLTVMGQASKFDWIKPTKNVIVLIPDGTSLSTVSLARWYQWYNHPDREHLNIDPYLCGMVRTTSSNAPIGDSAPTTSTYMTGQLSRTGYVSTYPESDPANDIIPTDPKQAYQPLATVLEASKWLHKKSTGLVFTCMFPHATPADCSAHSYNRNKYEWIAPQMAHNDLNVVIGGGTHYLSPADEKYLTESGYEVYKNDLSSMRNYSGNKMWALFADADMAFDIDRNPAEEPSIEEMTRKAISLLSKDPNGFFLMVEGSKVDWAAHANDPIAMATDFLAFDRACGAALEFARKEGETTVIILPDHGNSGLSIGSERCGGYDKLTKDQLFGQFSKYKRSSVELSRMLNEKPCDLKAVMKEYTGIELTAEEEAAINNCPGYKFSPIPADQRKKDAANASMYAGELEGVIAKVMTQRTCFGFTTHGHTGEDVFLAAYHPQNDIPSGMVTNVEINEYLCAVSGFDASLWELTSKKFIPHTKLFKEFNCQIKKEGDELPTLTVRNGRNQIVVTPFSSIVTVGMGKKTQKVKLSSVVVYVDKNDTFYVPIELMNYLK